jgi:hypothetical protein
MRPWFDGWRRVFSAPAAIVGVFILTVVAALPFALTLRDVLQDHFGASLAANEAADSVNYDWWQEFAAQADGIGTTFTTSVIGFATTLDSISGLLDRRQLITPIAAVRVRRHSRSLRTRPRHRRVRVLRRLRHVLPPLPAPRTDSRTRVLASLYARS